MGLRRRNEEAISSSGVESHGARRGSAGHHLLGHRWRHSLGPLRTGLERKRWLRCGDRYGHARSKTAALVLYERARVKMPLRPAPHLLIPRKNVMSRPGESGLGGWFLNCRLVIEEQERWARRGLTG